MSVYFTYVGHNNRKSYLGKQSEGAAAPGRERDMIGWSNSRLAARTVGLWVSPLRRGSSEGLPAALTRRLMILVYYPF